MRKILVRLQQENEELCKRVQALESALAESQAENRELRRVNEYLKNKVFGRSSEKLDPRQVEFPLGLAPAETAEKPEIIVFPVSTYRKLKKRNKPRIPGNLPTEDIIIEPEEVKNAPQDYKLIGEEVTSELKVVPPKYSQVRYIRRKYVSKLDRSLAPVIASLPARLIEGSYASPSLLTDILLQKYVDHIPFHRQEQILRIRYGIHLPRKTMCEWTGKVADWLKPVYNHIYDELRKCGYLQIDETPVRYCKAEGGGSAQGYFWVYNRPGVGVLYEWHTGRGAECLKSMLDGFVGTVQSDGYSAYGSYARIRNQREQDAGRAKAIELAACWAHARRKIFEARAERPRLTAWLLHQIGLMYRIESELRGIKAGPQLRQAVRASQTSMILERLGKVMTAKVACLLPQSGLGAAFRYTMGLWAELVRFRDDGRLEIDNNGVENAVRPTAIGKKNWLFIGHPEAGDRSAIIYTLLENCKRLGINPQEYLLDVLTRLPTMTNWHTHELTPSNWLAERKTKAA